LRADLHDGLHIISTLGKNDAVRRLERQIGGGVAVLLPKRLSGLEPVAELLLQNGERRRNALFVTLSRHHIFQRHRPSPPQHQPVKDSIRYEIPSGGMG